MTEIKTGTRKLVGRSFYKTDVEYVVVKNNNGEIVTSDKKKETLEGKPKKSAIEKLLNETFGKVGVVMITSIDVKEEYYEIPVELFKKHGEKVDKAKQESLPLEEDQNNKQV